MVDGVEQQTCSARCADVAATIDAAGFATFYRQRRGDRHLPVEFESGFADRLDAYDDPGLQQRFAESGADGVRNATLLIEGITCAACVRLVESRLAALDGVRAFSLNASTHRAQLAWDERTVRLSRVMRVIYDLGYAAYPFDGRRRQRLLAEERKTLLKRLALSVLLGMQLMMFTLALYGGAWSGMSAGIEQLLRWSSLVLVVPILGYCAVPFFQGARRALRNRELGMDVPVSLALVLAFAASAWATVAGTGEVYFESIAMFVTLLLASRYFELGARIKATQQFDELAKVIPHTVAIVEPSGALRSAPVTELVLDDVVLVKAGEVVPVDGEVVAGTSAVDEAILSGESDAIAKTRGAAVLGGSLNLDSPLQVRVRRLINDSLMAEISRLAQDAQSCKPRLTVLADRIASKFILGVLLIAAGVAAYWGVVDPSRVMATTIAVLVISCPCALALATPVAVIAASGAMMRNGIAALNPGVIETLAAARAFVFDKTGTLTTGRLQLVAVQSCVGVDETTALSAAQALGAHSEHTIGRALMNVPAATTHVLAGDIVNAPGEGISGTIDGERYWLGSAAYVLEQAGVEVDDARAVVDGAHKIAWLVRRGQALAQLCFLDEIKPGARELVADLHAAGITSVMLTGDRAAVAQTIADELGIDEVHADLRPADKLAELERRQAQGEVNVVVGDGVNDAPMIAQGFVSVAVGNACDLSKHQADLVLLRDNLEPLGLAYRTSRKTLRVIRQNITWAIGYNACALPLAIAGYVPPWLAALGMSLSSLLVVANATRINR
jgi:Cu2+-exporting ATPase